MAVQAAPGEHSPAEAKPKRAPGVLIVKFKEQAGDELKGALARGDPLHEVSISPSLDGLGLRYGLKNMRMLFPSLQIRDADGAVVRVKTMEEHVQRIREKFPVRAGRAPKWGRTPDLTRVFNQDLDEAVDVEAAAAEYAANHAVEYAHASYVWEPCWQSGDPPNDPYWWTSGSWGQGYDDLWGLKRINCGTAWNWSRGNDVVIAIIDSGIWYRRVIGSGEYEEYDGHPDIVPNLWVNEVERDGIANYDDDHNGYKDDIWGWNFRHGNNDPLDWFCHGTCVAGIAGAVGNNAIGVLGVAPCSRVMNVKVITQGGGPVGGVAQGVCYAVDNGADVLNMSGVISGKPWVLVEAVEYAYSHGCVIVAGAGNDGGNTNGWCPSNLKHTISVAATDYADSRAVSEDYTSCWGTLLDVAAPGGLECDMLSLGNWVVESPVFRVGQLYYRWEGTSMACPHVTGAAALLLRHYPSLNPEQVRQQLRMTAVDLGDPGFDDFYGHGRIDAAAVLNYAYPCSALILEPFDGGVHDGPDTFRICGVADGEDWNFLYWETEYARKDDTSNWTWVAADDYPKDGYYDKEMGTIDLTGFEPGDYFIRLTVGGWYCNVYDYVSFSVTD